MRITLRPGHGITPPHPYCYTLATGYRSWHRQRPGGYVWPGYPGRWYEDDYTALFCSQLVPALQMAGHEVVCQRALPGTPDGDAQVEVGPRQLPLLAGECAETWIGPRWQLCASVEGVLRGAIDPLDPCGWSWDPQMSCAWERSKPGDLYLSIHVNWYSDPAMHGIGAYHYPGSQRGQAHAQRLLDNIKGACARAGGDLAAWAAEDESAAHPWGSAEHKALLAAGERWGRYSSKLWELRQTSAPAVILELGFASHRAPEGPSDLDRLVSEEGRRAIVAGIVGGLP